MKTKLIKFLIKHDCYWLASKIDYQLAFYYQDEQTTKILDEIAENLERIYKGL